ncbi:MAG: cytochrome c biogenesis protein ResB, partial [Actinomycetota bacterium]|nr:cytochrome c biogenesis protein ResB [Actinomycetota bacterium]
DATPAPLSAAARTVGSGGSVHVEIGGLARTDQAGYGDEFTKLRVLVSSPDGPWEQRKAAQ